MLWSIGGLMLLAAGAVAFLVIAAPVGLVRDQIVTAVKAKTGRDLVIGGQTSLAVYPNLAITMGDVTLSQPPGMAGQPTARMQRLEVVVPLLPLLSRHVKVERLVLQQPVIELRVDKSGRRSWDFAEVSEAPRRIRLAQAGGGAGKFSSPELKEFMRQSSPQSREVQGSRSPAAALEGLALGDVRVIDGTISYVDERTGAAETVTAIDLQLGLPTLASPMEARGSLVWKAEKIGFDGRVGSFKALLEERPSTLAVKVSAKPVEASYDGSITLGGIPDLDGALTAKSPSVKALARWLGVVLPEARGFGALSMTGKLKTSDTAFTLADAKVGLDGATAQGTIIVEPRPVRPHVRANLQISELDLNKYIGPPGRTAAAPQPAAAPALTRPAAGPAKPANSIEELLQRSDGRQPAAKAGPQVRGFTQRAGWSEEAIDLTALGLIDLDAKLAIGRLLFEEFKVGQSQLTVALKDRQLRTTFDEVQLYEGRGRGLLTIDGSGKTAGIAANLTVDGVSAQPLLKDAGGMSWLAGRGKFAIAAGGHGASQRQLVEALDGKADFTFTDGSVVGFNVAQILRGLQQGRLSGLDQSETEKTDFSELAASFVITKGVAQNKDLRMASPLVRLTGTGTVDLPQRTVDYALRPKLVANLAGQGGAVNLSGLEIPIKVVGPWDKPQVTADIDGVLKNPEKAVEAVKEIGRQFKGGNAGEALKGLFGGKGGEGGAVRPKELLEGLLKR